MVSNCNSSGVSKYYNSVIKHEFWNMYNYIHVYMLLLCPNCEAAIGHINDSALYFMYVYSDVW